MRKTRLVSFLLVICLLWGACISTALAGKYASDISSVMSAYSSGNIRASSAPQQEANGAYRIVELLEILAYEKNCDASSVRSVMSSYRSGNIRANSAPQQLANGLYRSV